MHVEEQRSQETRQEFHEGIADGNPGPAVPAPAPQQQVAQKRYIVKKRYGMPAPGASRPRPDNGLPGGQAADDNIVKTPQNTSEYKNDRQLHTVGNGKRHQESTFAGSIGLFRSGALFLLILAGGIGADQFYAAPFRNLFHQDR